MDRKGWKKVLEIFVNHFKNELRSFDFIAKTINIDSTTRIIWNRIQGACELRWEIKYIFILLTVM